MAKRPPPPEDSLKRERAGTYRTRDGRFTVQQSSSGWLLLDGEQTDELGLPLARGPWATLDAARAAIADARSTPAPSSGIARRPGGRTRRAHLQALPDARPARARGGSPPGPARGSAAADAAAPGKPARQASSPVVIREIRAVDGDALRALWTAAGFRLLGDDDLGLARLARRNPGLVLVAAEGSRIVGSALGTWDGHRGWIYHVVTAPSHRRQGIATRLVDRIEDGLRALGCRKVNVMVRTDSDGGAAFWAARGYDPGTAVQYGKELEPD